MADPGISGLKMRPGSGDCKGCAYLYMWLSVKSRRVLQKRMNESSWLSVHIFNTDEENLSDYAFD